MTIGIIKVEVFIPEADSLKAKRMTITALKDRIKNNYNVSIAEVGDNDKWQKAILGIAAVGSGKGYINGLLDKVLDFIRRDHRLHITDFEIEIL